MASAPVINNPAAIAPVRGRTTTSPITADPAIVVSMICFVFIFVSFVETNIRHSSH